jgi:hypothetical protein
VRYGHSSVSDDVRQGVSVRTNSFYSGTTQENMCLLKPRFQLDCLNWPVLECTCWRFDEAVMPEACRTAEPGSGIGRDTYWKTVFNQRRTLTRALFDYRHMCVVSESMCCDAPTETRPDNNNPRPAG